MAVGGRQVEGCALLGIRSCSCIFFCCSNQVRIGNRVYIIFFIQMRLDSPEDLESQGQVVQGAAAAAGHGYRALRCGARGSTCILDNIFTKGIKSISQFKKNPGLLMDKEEQ